MSRAQCMRLGSSWHPGRCTCTWKASPKGTCPSTLGAVSLGQGSALSSTLLGVPEWLSPWPSSPGGCWVELGVWTEPRMASGPQSLSERRAELQAFPPGHLPTLFLHVLPKGKPQEASQQPGRSQGRGWDGSWVPPASAQTPRRPQLAPPLGLLKWPCGPLLPGLPGAPWPPCPGGSRFLGKTPGEGLWPARAAPSPVQGPPVGSEEPEQDGSVRAEGEPGRPLAHVSQWGTAGAGGEAPPHSKTPASEAEGL